MIKIRLEGKEQEINAYIENIKNDDKIEVYNISKLTHKSNEISLYWRCFLEVELVKDEDSDSRGNLSTERGYING